MYRFIDLARDILSKAERPLACREIWNRGVQNGLDQKVGSAGKTPYNTLSAQLSREVNNNPASEFYQPDRGVYFLRRRAGDILSGISEHYYPEPKVKESFSESDLHSLVAYIANSTSIFHTDKLVYTKTIRHQKSTHSDKFGEWLHPDMVGFHIPFGHINKAVNWDSSVVELNAKSDNNMLKLFSLELKRSLDKSNYRQSFFQAVSNSSWAHEGYLVTTHIEGDEELEEELKRLAQSFGIGIIELDLVDIASSRAVCSAQTKSQLDWNTINKLSNKNSDFQQFINNVKIAYDAKKIHESEFDAIKKDEEIEAHIEKMLKKK